MSKDINRRSFLKLLGGGAVATSALLTACKGNDNKTTAAKEPPKGKMTYRTNPKTGEKISILGYGMMRLPVVGGNDAKKKEAHRPGNGEPPD